MKNIVKIVTGTMSILGAIVGAGFMSGAEINQFFSRFGWIKYITFALIWLIIYVFIVKVWQKNAKTTEIISKNNAKTSILPICLIFVSATMMAGLCDIVSTFGVAKWVCVFVVGMIIYICLIVGVKFASVINVLTSFMLIVILPFIVYDTKDIVGVVIEFDTSLHTVFVAVLYAVFYATMNLATSKSIVEHAEKNMSRKQVKGLALIVSIAVVGLIAIISNISVKAIDSDMPLLELVGEGLIGKFFVVLLVFAMVSTLLSSCVGAMSTFKFFGKAPSSLITTCVITLVSFVGFGSLVKYVYPLIGAAILLNCIFDAVSKNLRKKTICC